MSNFSIEPHDTLTKKLTDVTTTSQTTTIAAQYRHVQVYSPNVDVYVSFSILAQTNDHIVAAGVPTILHNGKTSANVAALAISGTGHVYFSPCQLKRA